MKSLSHILCYRLAIGFMGNVFEVQSLKLSLKLQKKKLLRASILGGAKAMGFCGSCPNFNLNVRSLKNLPKDLEAPFLGTPPQQEEMLKDFKERAEMLKDWKEGIAKAIDSNCCGSCPNFDLPNIGSLPSAKSFLAKRPEQDEMIMRNKTVEQKIKDERLLKEAYKAIAELESLMKEKETELGLKYNGLTFEEASKRPKDSEIWGDEEKKKKLKEIWNQKYEIQQLKTSIKCMTQGPEAMMSN